MSEVITAAILAIGDELLSGRTKDKNIAYLANFLTLKGIDLKEARIVSDDQAAIVKAVNELRGEYDYVFTSGGIGPTHDDITADAMAVAFGVGIDYDPRALAILEPHYAARDMEFTTARKRMARLPFGSELIENKVSMAPGFNIGNVYVMAGVPAIFQAMIDALAPDLKSGVQLLTKAIDSPFGEGTIGDGLATIQKAHPETAIGSYPRFDGESYTTQILVRSRSEDAAIAAITAIAQLFDELGKGR